MNAVRGQYFDKLASLRFFAALMVVLCHLRLAPYAGIETLKYIGWNVFPMGFVGVSVFYVLSGFVISHANDNWSGWKRYAIGRVSRIYPPHLIVTLLFILFFGETIRGWGDAKVWLANFTLMQSWILNGRYMSSLNNVSWSLSVEIFFYAAFIFLRRLDDRRLYTLCIVSYALNLFLELILQDHSFRSMERLFGKLPLTRLPEFLMGMAIYRVYKGGVRLPRWVVNLDFLFIYLSMFTTVSILNIIGVNYIFLYSSVPALFAFLMVLALALGDASRYMRNRMLVLLGEASFALYLIHNPILGFAHRLLTQLPPPIQLWDTLGILIVVIGLSILFYLRVEVPVTRYTRRFLSEKLLKPVASSEVA